MYMVNAKIACAGFVMISMLFATALSALERENDKLQENMFALLSENQLLRESNSRLEGSLTKAQRSLTTIKLQFIKRAQAEARDLQRCTSTSDRLQRWKLILSSNDESIYQNSVIDDSLSHAGEPDQNATVDREFISSTGLAGSN
jgi:hypothetical protein